MTHYSMIWIFGHYFTTQNPGPAELTWVVIIGVMVLVGFAYVVMRWVDEPVRKKMKNVEM